MNTLRRASMDFPYPYAQTPAPDQAAGLIEWNGLHYPNPNAGYHTSSQQYTPAYSQHSGSSDASSTVSSGSSYKPLPSRAPADGARHQNVSDEPVKMRDRSRQALRAAERRQRQADDLAMLESMLPPSLQLFQDKTDMRIVPRAITCIQKLREEVEELKSRDEASLVAIQNLQQRNAYLEQERQLLRASITELQEREVERNNLILEMQHRIRCPEAGHFMTA